MRVDYATRAQALVGTRFRAQGRGEGGLDCVGVILVAFDIPVESATCNYRLRGDHLGELRTGLDRHFRRIRKGCLRPGDVMLVKAEAEQFHLAIRTEQGFVHAHAGIRRVVETPGLPEWPVIGVYRRRGRV